MQSAICDASRWDSKYKSLCSILNTATAGLAYPQWWYDCVQVWSTYCPASSSSAWWLLIGSVRRNRSYYVYRPGISKSRKLCSASINRNINCNFYCNWKDSSSRIVFRPTLKKKIRFADFSNFHKNMHIYPLFPWKWRFSTLGIELTATVYACTNPVAVTAGVRLSPCCVGALCKIFCKIFKN